MKDNRVNLLEKYLKDNTEGYLFEVDDSSNIATEVFFTIVSNGIEIVDEDIEVLLYSDLPHNNFTVSMNILGLFIDFYGITKGGKMFMKPISINDENIG